MGQNQGQAQTRGSFGAQALGAIGTLASAAGALGFSDIRLKENIVKIDDLKPGVGWYTWDWNDTAKAMGVDNIVRVWDDSWSELDSNGLQSVLKEAIQGLGANAVYCGKSAADTGAGSTGPGRAERLGWSNASNVIGADFGDAVTVSMPVEAGVAKITVPLPAVISCDKGDFKPRKANVKGIMMAKKAKVELMSASAPAASVVVTNHSMPAAKPAGKTFEGGSSASQVVQLLRDEANVI